MSKPKLALYWAASCGGCEIALACHWRYASENAKLGLPEVGLGIIPGYGGTQRLPRIVGLGRALELITTARMIDAAEALRIGLVNAVFPQAELLPHCERVAAEVLSEDTCMTYDYYHQVKRGKTPETAPSYIASDKGGTG